jgi:phytanoyl-CoA hydroxylase
LSESAAGAIGRHPWNQDFAWVPRQRPLRTLTDAQARQFDEDGFVVLERALDARAVAGLVGETDRIEALTEAFLRTRGDGRLSIAEAGAITFSTHLVTRSALIRALSASAPFVDLCADLIGDDVRLYWDQAVYKKPEKPRRFPWHQDNGYTFVEPQAYLTCWVALTDATAENGCPQIVPGVHRQGTLRHRFVDPLGWECFPDHPDKRVVEVPAGSIVVFSSLTPHLTGPNTSDSVRKAYILQYAPDGARMLVGDPAAGGPTTTQPCDDPGRQYPVLVGGRPVAPPPLPDAAAPAAIEHGLANKG